MRRPIPLASGQNEGVTAAISKESLTNWYPEAAPDGSPFPFTLRATPGLTKKVTVGTGPIRGMLPMRGDLFVVSGQELYTVNAAYQTQRVGVILGSGNVRMTTNGTQVGIATSKQAYAATKTSIVELAEQFLNGADYQDGFGLFTQANTQFFWATEPDDMATIPGLSFTSADADADNVVGILVNNEEVLVFKERTLEQYYNAGTSPFPYVRSQNGVVERGCASSGSIAQADRAALWLGDDLRVYLMQGLQPRPVSTSHIERLIQSQPAATSEAFTYEQQGHTFYVLSFNELTVVYSLSTGRWHVRQSNGKNRWRANSHARWLNREIVGDFESGNIYALDLKNYTEDGSTIIRTAVLPPVYAGGKPGFLGDLLFEIEGGAGLTTGQGSDPTLMLDWSDDLGNTWSSELTASLGPKGAFQQQVSFLRLGRFEKIRHLRISVSDPVPAHIVGAYADMAVGA